MFLLFNKKCTDLFYIIIKLALHLFTTLITFFGIGLIILSIWYMYEGREYQLDTSASFFVSSIAFIIGLLLVGISTCGFIGVLRENVFLSKLFLSGLLLLMIVESVSVLLIYVFRRKLLANANMIFEGFINTYSDDSDVRTIVDLIQSNLRCCGITSAQDWNNNIYYSCSSISTLNCGVPASCCRSYQLNSATNNFFCGLGVRANNTLLGAMKSIYVTGCKYEIYAYLQRKQNYTIGFLIASLIPQYLILLFICLYIVILTKNIKNYELADTLNYTNDYDDDCDKGDGIVALPNSEIKPKNNLFPSLTTHSKVYTTTIDSDFYDP